MVGRPAVVNGVIRVVCHPLTKGVNDLAAFFFDVSVMLPIQPFEYRRDVYLVIRFEDEVCHGPTIRPRKTRDTTDILTEI